MIVQFEWLRIELIEVDNIHCLIVSENPSGMVSSTEKEKSELENLLRRLLERKFNPGSTQALKQS